MNSMNWLAIQPEIVLLAMTCVVAVIDLFVKDSARRPTYWLAQLSILVVGAMHLCNFSSGLTVYAMQDMVVADPMGHLLSFFACLATFVTLVYTRPYAASRDMLKGELFSLAMFSLLGVNIMVAANNFLVVYLGLELMTLSLYALVALRRDHGPSTEAAMKYFVLGALASGFLLYGLSMLYGATGSLTISTVYQVLATHPQINKGVLVFGVVFIVAGLAFKLGAAPFHQWVPDVYHGAPTGVTLLIGAAPKLAAFAITERLLVEGLISQAGDWQQMLVVLAVLSLLIGNLAAIAQSNFKRMLAYSTIAQLGFMLLAMASGVVHGNDTLQGSNAYSSAMFYTITYVLTTLGTFGMITVLSRAGFEADEIKDLAGLAKRSPWFALVMTIFMFSLAGVPPMVGFYAKLSVLQAVVATESSFYVQLAVYAVVMSLIGAFYYLRVVKVMFFDEPADTSPLTAPADVRIVMTLNGLAVLVFGIIPGGLLAWCGEAIVKTLTT